MGRGRAKAKQTKVARELKYSSPGMDLDRLSRDLHTDGSPVSARPEIPDDTPDGTPDGDPHWLADPDDEDAAAS